MPIELTEVRRSQIITTYGPGAIVDLRAGGNGGTAISIIVGGLDEWDQSAGHTGVGLDHPQTISEPRLQKMLGVQGFRLPPVVLKDENNRYINSERLPGVRFPAWLHCPVCQTLKRASKWKDLQPGDPARYCHECSHKRQKPIHVIPVRFITCCEKGHIDEFPWSWWANHKGDCKNTEKFTLRAEGAGLAGLILTCTSCKERRPMDGCFSREAFENFSCSGNRPWLGDRESNCGSPPRAILRGASNVYFSALVSSLDIPPWADKIQQQLGVLDWNRLAAAPHDQKRLAIIEANDLAERFGISAEALLQTVKHRLAMLQMQTDETLRFDEYNAFLGGSNNLEAEFEITNETVPAELKQFFCKIVRVSRLREVRALRSFTRLKPPADWRASGSPNFASISIERKDWLPAIEVRGEGIFLELNPDALSEWESARSKESFWQERIKTVDENYRAEFTLRHGPSVPIPRTISLRFMLIHSLAHALMRQLALSSGYSTASLRERLYSDVSPREMSGVLIYTASPDADGTLGGLSRQARPQRILELTVAAIESMAWCSSDPLCIDGFMSRTEPLNPAACHSCLLAPETSCEEYNRLLDRAVLVGTPSDRSSGFFSPLLSMM